MTDKEEKAIERCNELIKVEHANWIGISNQKAIETVLKELEKKDKIIDEIAKTLKWALNVGLGFIPSSICTCKEDIRNCEDKICTDCIKEYFINKVDKENKDE